jgi:hypothetical protein
MKSTKKRTAPEILNRGSLMTYQDNGTERCFGYMFDFPGHGVFEPTFGKLAVSAEEARTHNQCLSQGEIEGLDKNCTVGLGGMFYTRKANGHAIVATWLGQEVSQEVQVRGSMITFSRKGMTFRGRLRKEEDCFYFKRIQ